VADFVRVIRLGPANSGSTRRGLFATRDLAAGDLLWCTKALVTYGKVKDRNIKEVVYDAILRKLQDNPITNREFLEKFSGARAKQLFWPDNEVVIDA
jgi:hypothetical protein